MSRKINLGLMGSSGKMGQAHLVLLEKKFSKNFNLFASVGRQENSLSKNHFDSIQDIPEKVLSQIQVWIDFSSPEGLKQLIKISAANQTPIVSGTTGLNEKDFLLLKKESAKRPIFWASNMSPGLWVFRQALKSFSLAPDFDFSLDEIHHTQKKDQPSGTAKTLHSDLEKILQRKIETPTSRRIGGVFGVHTVFAASDSEVITFQHQALNRGVFAEGSLRAALWLANKKPGYYSMDDLFLKAKGK